MFGASNMLPHSMPHMSLCCRLRCCFQPARSTVFIAVTMAVRPGVPLVCLGLRRFCVAGVGQLLLRGRRGTMCTAKGSDVRPPLPNPPPVLLLCGRRGTTAFAWQAWDNVHCQGVAHSLAYSHSLSLTLSHFLRLLVAHSLTTHSLYWLTRTCWYEPNERLKLRRFHVCELRQCVSVIMLLWWFQAGLINVQVTSGPQSPFDTHGVAPSQSQ